LLRIFFALVVKNCGINAVCHLPAKGDLSGCYCSHLHAKNKTLPQKKWCFYRVKIKQTKKAFSTVKKMTNF